MEKWLKEDDTLKLLKIDEVKGILFQVYIDEPGQSFHLAWISPRTGEVKTWCCGTYNDYKREMEDIAEYELGVRYDNGGH